MSKTPCLVTGGSGFLGKHIVQQLIDSNKYDVTVFDIAPCGIDGAIDIKGDLRNLDDVKAAVKGKEVIFHVATAAPTGENTLNKHLMEDVNVTGTQHVILAAQDLGVKKIVYTSSASVIFQGQSLRNADESTPYAKKPMDFYTKTKIDGEKLILAANGVKGVATVALRPSGIFGEFDRVMVPTLVKQAKKGKMKYIIGNGKNKMDFTYAGNVAQAHLQAADALTSSTAPPAGKPYFITNKDPVPVWGFFGDILNGLDYARPSIKLPFFLIFFLAFVFEYLIRPLLRPFKDLSSDFTCNRILIVSRDRVFDGSAATRDFGYEPKVPVKEALARTVAYFKGQGLQAVPGEKFAKKTQ